MEAGCDGWRRAVSQSWRRFGILARLLGYIQKVGSFRFALKFGGNDKWTYVTSKAILALHEGQ